MQVLDSDVLIDLLRGHAPALAWLAQLPESPKIAGFAAMELIEGARNAQDLRTVRRLLNQFEIAWPVPADCGLALRSFEALHLSHRLGLLDALIAATAVGLGATLCTFNVKHYRHVPQLVTERPYAR